MDLRLSGKRALVTGSAGIGASIVRHLANENVDVVIHGRDEQRGKHLVKELTRTGRHAVFITADLAVATDCGGEDARLGRPLGANRSERARELSPDSCGSHWKHR